EATALGVTSVCLCSSSSHPATKKGSRRVPAALAPSGRNASGSVVLVAPVDLVPVDRVPPLADVVRAAVLVLEVVGVLPDVDAEERLEALHHRGILVRQTDDVGVALGVEDEPRPAGAELAGGGLVEGLLEGVEAAP